MVMFLSISGDLGVHLLLWSGTLAMHLYSAAA